MVLEALDCIDVASDYGVIPEPGIAAGWTARESRLDFR
jgi:hypothetical protein